MAASAKIRRASKRRNGSSDKSANGRSKAKPVLRFLSPSNDVAPSLEIKKPPVEWAFNEHGPNIHEIVVDLGSRSNEFQMLLVSDMHWDNPHCDRKLLARHLDQAVERNAPILSAGDLFCAMQGKYDKRSDKSCVLPEHQKSDYLDALVRTAVDWFQPYASHMVVAGDGNHECLDKSTDVLTERGWVGIADVSEGDKVFSLDPENKKAVCAVPTKIHSYDYTGEMVHVKSRFVDMLMTPNHRVCYLQQKTKYVAYRLAGDKFSLGSTTVIPTGGSLDLPDYEIVSDDEIRLTAWMMTDGCFGKKWSLYQSKPTMVEKIDSLLERMGVEFRKKVRNRDIESICGVALKSKSLPCHEWFLSGTEERFRHLNLETRDQLPSWCWKMSRRQFNIFLETLIDGNGSRHKSCLTSQMLYGKREILEDVQSLCVLNGHRAMLSERKRKVVRGTNGNYLCLNITENDSVSFSGEHVSRVPYEGKVYCLTTKWGNFFARRNGKVFVTGNSAIQNHHETRLTDRLAAGLRDRGGITRAGGYSGWIRLRFTRAGSTINSIVLWYHHGFGGGGPVTMGKIDFNRYSSYIDADVIVAGHVHYKEAFPVVHAYLTAANQVKQRSVYMVRCGTYKDEFGTGEGGFHVEKGRGPRPLGGYWLRVKQIGDDLAVQVDEAGQF